MSLPSVIMQSYYNDIDHTLCAVHYIPITYLFYNWKFVMLYLTLWRSEAASEIPDQTLSYSGFFQIGCYFNYWCFLIFLLELELCIFITMVIFWCLQVFGCFLLFGHRGSGIIICLKVFAFSKQ